MVESVFRGGLAFLEEVGVYDVVLPFLLTFTLVYALLEKTKILGVQKDPFSSDKTEYPKRNLNSLVAFVIAFFVIASSKLVELINKTVSQIFILLLLGVMFMLVAGTFNKDEEYFLPKKYQNLFMWLSFIVILLIFLNAMGWLEIAYNFLSVHWSGQVVSSLILLGVVAIFIIIMTTGSKKPSKPKSDDIIDEKD